MSLAQWLDDLDGELRAAAGPRPPRRVGIRMPAAAAAALLAVFAVTVLGLLREDAELPATPPPPQVRTVPAPEVIGEPEPYMGVACSEANRIDCDRVGLSVWLREPARAVTAEVGGRTFALDDDEWTGHSADRYRSAFAGFLQPAGLGSGDGPLRVRPGDDGRWLGEEPVSAPVTLTITLGTGERVQTTLEVELAAGWG